MTMEKMNFQNYPHISKQFGDSRLEKDHPLRIKNSNIEYMYYVETILRELDSTPNLQTKIKKMKKTPEWESIFSELEFAKRVLSLKPNFVKEGTKKGIKTPDLRVTLLDKELFFEIEMLIDTTQHSRIENAVSKTLPCSIMIQGIVYNEKTADGLIEFLKNKLDYKQARVVSFKGITIEVMPTKFLKGIVFGYSIPFESIKKKILISFSQKLQQFKSHKPIFWVVDSKKFEYSHASMENILYNINDGLFQLEEAKCLNGIVAIIHGNIDLFLNPNVEQQIDDCSINRLRDLLTVKLY